MDSGNQVQTTGFGQGWGNTLAAEKYIQKCDPRNIVFPTKKIDKSQYLKSSFNHNLLRVADAQTFVSTTF